MGTVVMGQDETILGYTIAAIAFITPVVGVLYPIFRDLVSPTKRIKELTDAISALDAPIVAELMLEPEWDQRQVLGAKRVLRDRLAREINKIGKIKTLWIAGIGFGVCLLEAIVSFILTIRLVTTKLDLANDNPWLFFGLGVLFLMITAILGAVSWLLWVHFQDVKHAVNINKRR